MSKMKTTLKLGAAFAALLAASPIMADGEYGVLMKTLANPFWGAMGQGVEEGAQAVPDVPRGARGEQLPEVGEALIGVHGRWGRGRACGPWGPSRRVVDG